MTREQWLNNLTGALRPMFEEAAAPIPANVRASIGWPSSGITSRAIGECWSTTASKDGTFEIFLRPTHETDMEIAATHAHELVHAAVGLDAGHGPKFKKVALAIGLKGKMTATVAGPAFIERVTPILAQLGTFPGAPMQTGAASSRKPKQSTRMIKCQCGYCGYIVRTTRRWIDEVGAPHCPNHGEMDVTGGDE